MHQKYRLKVKAGSPLRRRLSVVQIGFNGHARLRVCRAVVSQRGVEKLQKRFDVCRVHVHVRMHTHVVDITKSTSAVVRTLRPNLRHMSATKQELVQCTCKESIAMHSDILCIVHCKRTLEISAHSSELQCMQLEQQREPGNLIVSSPAISVSHTLDQRIFIPTMSLHTSQPQFSSSE